MSRAICCSAQTRASGHGSILFSSQRRCHQGDRKYDRWSPHGYLVVAHPGPQGTPPAVTEVSEGIPESRHGFPKHRCNGTESPTPAVRLCPPLLCDELEPRFHNVNICGLGAVARRIMRWSSLYYPSALGKWWLISLRNSVHVLAGRRRRERSIQLLKGHETSSSTVAWAVASMVSNRMIIIP